MGMVMMMMMIVSEAGAQEKKEPGKNKVIEKKPV